MTSKKSKNSLSILLGIPIVLLVISLILIKEEKKGNLAINDNNPYLKQMPSRYANALSIARENDSTFFCYTIEDFTIRELVVFKKSPSAIDVKTDFTIELYPTNKKHLKENNEFITVNIVKDAVLFNNNNTTYGVFKAPLPIIDIEKLIIKQKGSSSIEILWIDVKEQPFNYLENKTEVREVDKGDTFIIPNAYSSLFTEALKPYNIESLPSFYSLRDDTLFNNHQSLANYCKTNNKTIGKVYQSDLFWQMINDKNQNIENQIEFEGKFNKEANQLFSAFLNENAPFESVFNIKKLALFNALKNVFTNNCNEELYFLYNETDNLLEPFYLNSKCLGQPLKFLYKSKLDNSNYIKAYANALQEVSQINFYNTLIKGNTYFKDELALINDYYNETIFDFDIIKINQRVIRKSLNPSSTLKTELISVDSKKMTLSVFNVSNYTIDVLGLNHNNKKEISSLNPVREILSSQKDTIIIDLPRSFENLFVSKKKKITGFVLPKHIYDLNIKYRISGLSQAHTTSIIPYQKEKFEEKDLFRSKAAINNHKDLVINQETKEIYFSKLVVTLSEALVIPKGYMFKLHPGTTIDITKGGMIISHSPLYFVGTLQKPINIYSSDKKGQGILVLSEEKKSKLKYVNFNYLTNPKHGSWSVTGAITFYESPVSLENVTISNNSCEDALNIVRTDFEMISCSISNTQSDAFDGDFVKGKIVYCKFIDLGNDAIDVSGSELDINGVTVINAGDKGLSAGENSRMVINDVDISKSEIGIAGKDLSIVEAKNLKISNTKLGFTAFKKKPEFGPSNITVNGVVMDNIETRYLIESSSSLFIDGEKVESTKNVKERMYGVEFGVSSEETRNKN